VQATRDIASTLARVDAIPDALIIDRSLPDCDGRDLIAGLRARAIDASALFIVDGDAPADARPMVGLGAEECLVRLSR
jgi:DNA-binding NarL/FixJ family response regulator